MKILKSKGPKEEPCGTPLHIFFQGLNLLFMLVL